MNRVNILNELIRKYDYKSYLELGIRNGDCFNNINCLDKIGVDPDRSSAATHFMTSDEFFEENKSIKKTWDLVFIDGLHHSTQVDLDIQNALECLNKGGKILMHDCLPTTRRMQEIPLEEQGEWTGNTWESFAKLRSIRDDLSMFTIDTDYGCGLIFKGNQSPILIEGPLNYDGFVKYRNYWMNVISVDQFKQRFLD